MTPNLDIERSAQLAFSCSNRRGVNLPALKPGEALRLIDAADSVRDKAIISLSLAGLTADAISKLKVKDLDLQKGTVRW